MRTLLAAALLSAPAFAAPVPRLAVKIANPRAPVRVATAETIAGEPLSRRVARDPINPAHALKLDELVNNGPSLASLRERLDGPAAPARSAAAAAEPEAARLDFDGRGKKGAGAVPMPWAPHKGPGYARAVQEQARLERIRFNGYDAKREAMFSRVQKVLARDKDAGRRYDAHLPLTRAKWARLASDSRYYLGMMLGKKQLRASDKSVPARIRALIKKNESLKRVMVNGRWAYYRDRTLPNGDHEKTLYGDEGVPLARGIHPSLESAGPDARFSWVWFRKS